MIEYNIVMAWSVEVIERSVRADIEQGWYPIGGLCVAPSGPPPIHVYYQAMVRGGGRPTAVVDLFGTTEVVPPPPPPYNPSIEVHECLEPFGLGEWLRATARSAYAAMKGLLK